jgi:hypothetical protein
MSSLLPEHRGDFRCHKILGLASPFESESDFPQIVLRRMQLANDSSRRFMRFHI